MEPPITQECGARVYIQTWDDATKRFNVEVVAANAWEPSNSRDYPDALPKLILRPNRRQARRFESRLDKSDGFCWLWTGAKLLHGYGVSALGQHGKQRSAHQLAYRLWIGEVYYDHEIHHRCGVRACCNPKHLVQLTIDDHRILHFPTCNWKPHPVRRRQPVKSDQTFEGDDQQLLGHVA